MDKNSATLLVKQTIALEKSVLKWEKINSGLRNDKTKIVTESGSDDCACCKEFLKDMCVDCPICLSTDSELCVGSPYDTWREALSDEEENRINKTKLSKTKLVTLRKAALKELNFLKRLHKNYLGKIVKEKNELVKTYTILHKVK